MFITHCTIRTDMAKAVTGSFTITGKVSMTAAGYGSVTIPIGSLIDVGDAQALEVESVDYVYQNYDTGADVYEPIGPSQPIAGDGTFGAQLMDRNAGTFISADDNNLISSSALAYGHGDNIHSSDSDFFPDDFQKTNGRFVVNDEMYLVGRMPTAPATDQRLDITARIRAKVVKLSTRDWMAISLETVQNE